MTDPLDDPKLRAAAKASLTEADERNNTSRLTPPGPEVAKRREDYNADTVRFIRALDEQAERTWGPRVAKASGDVVQIGGPKTTNPRDRNPRGVPPGDGE